MTKLRWTSAPTFTAQVWMGSNKGHTQEPIDEDLARQWVWEYCKQVSMAVSVLPCDFYYPGGTESGICIGLINYPPYPRTPTQLRHHALELGLRLKQRFDQDRVTVVFPDETVTLGDEEVEE